MTLHFTKMEGAGNDYVYVDGFREHVPAEQKPELVRRLSDRHFGIGGDGVIFINPSEKADFEMEMYNADGSRGQMCGNGIRCVGKYVYDHGMTAGRSFTVESFGAVKKLTVEETDAAGKASVLRVNMGAPILEASEIPVTADSSPVVDEPIAVRVDPAVGNTLRRMGLSSGDVASQKIPAEGDGVHSTDGSGTQGGEDNAQDAFCFHMTCVSMGNPHAVVFVDHVDDFPVQELGPYFEHHKRFPERTNTEFVEVVSRDYVKMRVWERGTGETLACGTGCCATAVACVLNHRTDDTITVEVRGGKIRITWDRKANEIWMTGPARTAFEGEIGI